ncbi:DUF4880 domain-containing protein [Cupriavidus basilensis]
MASRQPWKPFTPPALPQASDARASARVEPHVIAQAADWMSRLQSGAATAADNAACEQWRQADPAHELAWRRMALLGQDLRTGLDQMPPAVARKALHSASTAGTARRASRRSALKSIAGLGVAAGGICLAREQLSWRNWNTWTADHRTRQRRAPHHRSWRTAPASCSTQAAPSTSALRRCSANLSSWPARST